MRNRLVLWYDHIFQNHRMLAHTTTYLGIDRFFVVIICLSTHAAGTERAGRLLCRFEKIRPARSTTRSRRTRFTSQTCRQVGQRRRSPAACFFTPECFSVSSECQSRKTWANFPTVGQYPLITNVLHLLGITAPTEVVGRSQTLSAEVSISTILTLTVFHRAAATACFFFWLPRVD